MNEQLKTQVLEQLKSANNVLVAVSTNPTVDELSASIALTLLLNKMNKHATTVFSGVVPSTLEFLQPEKTIETTTDSLRDFIIALDKSKADKLRYKVEDDVVRIFITPYRTSINDKDLEFSQGDFNVDVVLALGVTKREDLDRAITSHGRILHDATVISLTKREAVSELGSMNWQEPQASSLCEMVSVLSLELDRAAIDGQMATALMTGIIAETDRFRNNKTTPLALSLSSQLMSAGANQQLIAEKLEEPEPELIPELPTPIQALPVQDTPAPILEEVKKDDGELEIEHENAVEKIHIDENGNLSPTDEDAVLPLAQPQQKPAYMEDNDPEETVNENTPNGPLADLFAPTEEPTVEAVEEEPEAQISGLHTNNEPVSTGSVVQPEPKDLDAPSESTDTNDTAAVPAAEHEIPTMTHGRTILPPNHGDKPLSDKPFDLQEALKHEIAKEETAAGTLPVAPRTAQPLAAQQPQAASNQQYSQPLPISTPQPIADPSPPLKTASLPPLQDESLLALEKAIDSPHVKDLPAVNTALDIASPVTPPGLSPQQQLDSVRDSVAKAADAVVSPFPTPSKSLGAQPLDMQSSEQVPQTAPAVNTPKVYDPNAAPPVPPPMPLAPQFYDSDGKNHSPLNS